MPVREARGVRRPQVRAVGAGMVNSIFGYAVIVLALNFGASSYRANAIGYCTGWVLSFILHRHYVFSLPRSSIRHQAPRFAVAAAVSYGVNVAVLAFVENGLGLGPLFAQLCAMVTYSCTLFVLSREFVFKDRDIRITDNRRVMFACVCAAVVAFLIVSRIRLTHDVAWQLWIARQIAGGAVLYVDIVEVNPPLWFWMGLGVHHIAQLLGGAATTLLKAFLVVFGLLSVLLTDSLSKEKGPTERIRLVIASFVVITLLPTYDFGQREQLALMAALPYCALIGARCRSEPVPLVSALSIGLFSAIGFALKHYFAVVPMLLEIVFIFTLRRRYRALRPETLSLAFCAALYAAAIMVFTPEFLTHIVPMVTLAYGGYENSLLFQLLGRHQIVIYAIIVAVVFHRDILNFRTPNVMCYLVASLGFGIAYFAQQKGWQYHALPVGGLLLIALITLMLEAKARLVPARAMLLGVVALIAAVWTSAIWIGPYRSGGEEAFDFATQDLMPGDTVFVASTGPRFAWPMIEERKFRWPSRYFALWTTAATELPGKSKARDAELDDLARDIRANTFHDLSCNPPKVIMVESPLRNGGLEAAKFSYMGYLRENSALSRFLDGYRYIDSRGGADVYLLMPGADLPPKPSDCRRVV